MIKISEKLKFLMAMTKAGAVLARKFHGQGLGFGDFVILYAITGAPEGKIRPTDLAEAVGLTASGVTRLILPLEKIGMVKRMASQRDARISYVTLTASGQRIFTDAVKWIEFRCDDLIPDSRGKDLKQATELFELIAN